ncbi:MAG: hypothetical protein FRX48_09518 [Lasallia pustulata]|uniref:Uncharacterized protein n=1 Tax=Lasallia pustulata TaxID=136370 RepID=A0A5M8PCX3_9LECA|nr:MAG: hypothetical protein FRX48_09518 [Lasallia pustulata]
MAQAVKTGSAKKNGPAIFFVHVPIASPDAATPAGKHHAERDRESGQESRSERAGLEILYRLPLHPPAKPPPPPLRPLPPHPRPHVHLPPPPRPLAPPPLTTAATHLPALHLPALRLIADSIAQQRQLSSRLLLAHPLTLALAFAVLAAVAQVVLARPHGSWALVGTTWAGCVMALLVGYGEAVIGCAVLRIVAGERERGKGKRGRGGEEGAGEGVDGGVEVEGEGCGEGLLEEAVRVAVVERGCEAVEFAEVHANSGRVLPKIFNGGFDRREQRARKTLQEVVDAQMATGRKR